MNPSRILVDAIAAAGLVLLIPTIALGSESRSHVSATGLQTTRMFQVGPGRAARTFSFRERSGVILLNRITVRHGARVFVDARIPHLAGARVSSWQGRNTPSLSCRRTGAFDVCTQGEEWCPMPQATWHFHLVKLSGPAGRIRFDYVVAPPPPNG